MSHFKRLSLVLIAVASLSACGQKQGNQRKATGSVQAPATSPTTSNATANNNTTPTNTTTFTCPKYPIVLHHGFMAGKRVGMFVKTKEHFTQKGCKVFETEVAAVQTSEYRGKQLASQLKQIIAQSGAAKLNIIAHSQGGLDARYAISNGGAGDIVASLSTLSTPHQGTPLADLSVQMSGPIAQQALSVMLNLMGRVINTNTSDPDTIAAANSMTTNYVKTQFNAANPDKSGVFYQSWAGSTGGTSKDVTKAMLKLSVAILSTTAGTNDGVVPVESAKWGEFRGVLEADHLDLIGYKLFDSGGFDHLKFLEQVASELAAKSF